MDQSQVSKKGPVLKGVAAGLAAGVVILLLFGLVGKSWLVGVLAGGCCFVGFFCITFAWSYLRAVERFYREHPELLQKAEEPTDSETSPEDEQNS